MADTIVTLMVPLVNEIGEWRAVKAMRQREDIYVVLGPMAEGDEWKFPPGTMVRRKAKIMSNGKEEMIATPL